jgi:Gluconate 2-dehydrogenase subunit 3
VGETIIPTTNTPGAKAAQVGELMKVMVTDCYTEQERNTFIKGIDELEAACKKANGGKGFAACTPQQRKDFLITLEKEAKAFNEKKDAGEKAAREAAQKANKDFEGAPPHYYTMMKQLTIWGYFTSKIGATEALRHVPIPGKYDGAYPYKKGDRAFS